MVDVLTDVRRITDAFPLPLLVDIDTGWGSALNIARAIRQMIKAGAAAVHIEDQVGAKRCGHLPGKELVPAEEMAYRIKAAVSAKIDARTDPDLSLWRAPTHWPAKAWLAPSTRASLCGRRRRHDLRRGRDGTLDVHRISLRCGRADSRQHHRIRQNPLFTREELADAGVDIVLYCCAAYRAMNAAALKVYETIRAEGTQKSVLPLMQSREDLYRFLDYHAYRTNSTSFSSKLRKRSRNSLR